MVWNFRDTEGLPVPPGRYQARLTVEGRSQTQPFNLLIDPRIAAGGVTVADLEEQYAHNKKMNAMVAEVDALIARVRAAQQGGSPDVQRRIRPLAEALITAPIRYSAPGLRDHITYLRGMTARVDMKIGRDAIERHTVLRAELDDLTRQVNAVLGPGEWTHAPTTDRGTSMTRGPRVLGLCAALSLVIGSAACGGAGRSTADFNELAARNQRPHHPADTRFMTNMIPHHAQAVLFRGMGRVPRRESTVADPVRAHGRRAAGRDRHHAYLAGGPW